MPTISKTFVSIIIFEIALIGFLLYNINYHWHLMTTSVTFVSKNDINKPENTKLKHFYELSPGSAPRKLNDVPPWLTYVPKVTINADNLNERFDYMPGKHEGVFRIVVLGDSWTFGQFVSTKDNFSERLEDMLNNDLRCSQKKIEVINLGVGGYDLEYSVEHFRLKGEKYKPDMVIWFLHTNDFTEINEFILPRIKSYSAICVKPDPSKDNYTDSNGKATAMPICYTSAWEKAQSDQKKKMRQEELLAYDGKMLKAMKEIYSGPLLIYTLSKSKIAPSKEAVGVIENFVQSSQKSYFYPSSLKIKQEDQLPDNHPNSIGHNKIAGDLFGYLKSNYSTYENGDGVWYQIGSYTSATVLCK